MTVAELIEALQGMNPNSEVIVQKDAEGNGYSPLSAVDGNAVYVPETPWSGSVYSTDWTNDEACMDADDWEEMLLRDRCVVLAPTN